MAKYELRILVCHSSFLVSRKRCAWHICATVGKRPNSPHNLHFLGCCLANSLHYGVHLPKSHLPNHLHTVGVWWNFLWSGKLCLQQQISCDKHQKMPQVHWWPVCWVWSNLQQESICFWQVEQNSQATPCATHQYTNVCGLLMMLLMLQKVYKSSSLPPMKKRSKLPLDWLGLLCWCYWWEEGNRVRYPCRSYYSKLMATTVIWNCQQPFTFNYWLYSILLALLSVLLVPSLTIPHDAIFSFQC